VYEFKAATRNENAKLQIKYSGNYGYFELRQTSALLTKTSGETILTMLYQNGLV
jgi:hypothetical protein